jgi:hypothetical protein
MSVLDPRAVEVLADIICSVGGPYERRVRDLLKFLRAAGWQVEYEDGQGRVPWLIDIINRRNDDPDAIEALLKRIIDPREYEGGLVDAKEHVGPVNAAIALDGYEVGHESGRPFVRRITEGQFDRNGVVAGMTSRELRSKVEDLVGVGAVFDLLMQRLDEVDICRRHGAYLLAVVGTGAFVEGVLYEVLRPRDPETRNEKKSTLDALLSRAYKHKWIEHDAHTFGAVVRDYRNLVHPRRQHELGAHCDEDTVLLCWQPVLAMVNDLHRLVPRIPR